MHVSMSPETVLHSAYTTSSTIRHPEPLRIRNALHFPTCKATILHKIQMRQTKYKFMTNNRHSTFINVRCLRDIAQPREDASTLLRPASFHDDRASIDSTPPSDASYVILTFKQTLCRGPIRRPRMRAVQQPDRRRAAHDHHTIVKLYRFLQDGNRASAPHPCYIVHATVELCRLLQYGHATLNSTFPIYRLTLHSTISGMHFYALLPFLARLLCLHVNGTTSSWALNIYS